jgi:hypothetical protein
MNRSVASLLALSAAVTLAVSGCAGDPASETASAKPEIKTYQVDGYPLDRSLDGLAGMTSLESIAIVSGVRREKSVWLTPDGAAPEMPAAENGSTPSSDQLLSLVTPFSGTVSKVIVGTSSVSTKAAFAVVGGTLDGVQVDVSDELAPDPAAVVNSGNVLVAGELDTTQPGVTTIRPSFVYSIGADGDTLTSLLDSASDEARPVFSLKDLEARLAAQKG